MTETMLTALDQQMALLGEAQKPEGSLISNVLTPRQLSGSSNIGKSKTTSRLLMRQRINILIYIYWSCKITE